MSNHCAILFSDPAETLACREISDTGRCRKCDTTMEPGNMLVAANHLRGRHHRAGAQLPRTMLARAAPLILTKIAEHEREDAIVSIDVAEEAVQEPKPTAEALPAAQPQKCESGANVGECNKLAQEKHLAEELQRAKLEVEVVEKKRLELISNLAEAQEDLERVKCDATKLTEDQLHVHELMKKHEAKLAKLPDPTGANLSPRLSEQAKISLLRTKLVLQNQLAALLCAQLERCQRLVCCIQREVELSTVASTNARAHCGAIELKRNRLLDDIARIERDRQCARLQAELERRRFAFALQRSEQAQRMHKEKKEHSDRLDAICAVTPKIDQACAEAKRRYESKLLDLKQMIELPHFGRLEVMRCACDSSQARQVLEAAIERQEEHKKMVDMAKSQLAQALKRHNDEEVELEKREEFDLAVRRGQIEKLGGECA